MKATIIPTARLSPILLSQVKEFCPWENIQQNLWNNDCKDNWARFVNQWLSGYLLGDDDRLISYGVIAQDSIINRNFARYVCLKEETTITLLYLFTVSDMQQHWYATKLAQLFLDYLKKDLPHIQYLICNTRDEIHSLLCELNWSIKCTIKNNTEFIAKEKLLRTDLHIFDLNEINNSSNITAWSNSTRSNQK